MPRKVGHTRPVGTVWRMRIHSWRETREPQLGDLVWEDPEELKRGFRVVGVEETSKPSVWWLHVERIEWDEFIDGLVGGNPSWAFVRDRR